jgi:thiosulfate/3-mercaptopyruvate sulfurtransferase
MKPYHSCGIALIVLVGVLMLVFSINGLQSREAIAGMDTKKADLFTDAAWLSQNLTSVIVVDARSDKNFQKAHIPGAVSAPWQPFTYMEGKPGNPGWGVLLPQELLAAKIGALGIDGRKPVIVYADPPGWGEDGRFAWMARMVGIKDVKILDGGLAAWKQAGGEISKATLNPPNRTMKISTWDKELTATTDWIQSRLGRIKIVDSRTESEFDGARKYGEARGGHLPGAISIPFGSLFNSDGTVKNPLALKQLFQTAGLKPEDEIVAYCTAGIRSAHMALVMRMVGFGHARNYDASFYDWAARKNLNLE